MQPYTFTALHLYRLACVQPYFHTALHQYTTPVQPRISAPINLYSPKSANPCIDTLYSPASVKP